MFASPRASADTSTETGAATRPPAPVRRSTPRGSRPGLGNQAALRLASGGTLQAKLAIGAVDDPLEHEADRVADQVMRMADPAPPLSASQARVSRKCAACEDEEKSAVRMKAADGQAAAETAPPIVESVLSEPGRPLDRGARTFLEPRFGRDFSGVKVHTDARADASCRAIGALAYTAGDHVVFGQGQYQPGGEAGRRLLSHELAHVAQQGAAPVVRRQVDAGVPPPAGVDADAGAAPAEAPPAPPAPPPERKCGPDITTPMTALLGRVGTWFGGLTPAQQHRSCMALGPAAPLALVNPIMAWDTRELFLPDTGWLDAYFTSPRACGSPRDPGCPTDPTRSLCETAGSCGNSVMLGGKCMLAGTANYALFGKMCRLCHDKPGQQFGRWDMRALIWLWKIIPDDPGPPIAVATAAYDGTFPTMPAAAENRGTCRDCGATHGGAFDFVWEPYQPR